jgi:signal peptidase I
MTLIQWFVLFLIVQVVHFLGTWKLYEAAGRKKWEAAVPVYNAMVLMKIINRSPWWTILLFVPVINLIMFPVVWVETLRSFGKNSTLDTILGIFTFGFYIYYLNYTQKLVYIENRSLEPSNKTADTIGSLLYAIVVATLVHTYVMQPYTIPTSSLEKSLLVGDFLFVSKFHYGARTPMTPIAAPMVHDTMPIFDLKSFKIKQVKSYSSFPQLPYFRFFAMQEVNRTDIVVFNWPADTLYNMYKAADKRYDKPIDKKTNYVKRCVGIPGDSLSIKDGIVYVNGKILPMPERSKPQYSYTVTTDGTGFDSTYLSKELNITDGVYQSSQNTFYFRALTEESSNRLRQNPIVKSVIRNISHEPEAAIFPYNTKWNLDNFGPVYIPKKGVTVALNTESLPFYKKIIGEYENNELKVNGSEIRINGKIATSYTFKQNYYWMMGDNRHNSLDARYFGYTPEDHIVGKPVFIWMSLDPNGKGLNKIRWDRMFTTVSGDGQPQSYFKFFLFALIAYFGISYFVRKKKGN